MSFQQRLFHPYVLSILASSLIFLSGCNAELHDVCSGKYDGTLTTAMARLQPFQLEGRRNLASAPAGPVAARFEKAQLSPVHLPKLNEEQREQWQSWADSELKRVEAYIDWANLHREESAEGEKTRRRLTDTANRLVAFHGYSQEGRVERMMETLRTLEVDRQEIQASVCAGR